VLRSQERVLRFVFVVSMFPERVLRFVFVVSRFPERVLRFVSVVLRFVLVVLIDPVMDAIVPERASCALEFEK